MLGLGFGLNKWRRLGGGYVGLLDLYPNAAAAYSLRKLRAAYSGSAVRVRKEVSLVSSETDIGFLADGTLDTVSLLAFASDADSGDVFVSIWYDQTQNDPLNQNNATQSLAVKQPKIVSAGSLVAKNGSAAIQADGVDDIMSTASSILSTDFSVFAVAGNNDLSNANSAMASQYSSSASSGRTIFYTSRTLGSRQVAVQIGTTYSITGVPTSDHHLYYYNRGGSNLDFAIDGGTASNKTNSNAIDNEPVDLFAIPNISSYSENFIKELIFFASDQSANRTGISDNINAFYSIYP